MHRTPTAFLIASGLVLTAVVAAGAEPSRTVADPPVVPEPVVRTGDRDGDRLADDLELTLAATGADDLLDVVVAGLDPATARGLAPGVLSSVVPLDIIDGFSARLTPAQVRALGRASGVHRIEPDRVFTGADQWGIADFGAGEAREDLGLDGDGVGICIADNGITADHEQFDGDIAGSADFAEGPRPDPGAVSDLAGNGHGTHVASIAAGDGGGSAPPFSSAAQGVAPGAEVYVARVLNNNSGSYTSVIGGIDWCAAQPGVDIINLSVSAVPTDGTDAASLAVEAAVAAGKVVVAAAGNEGDRPRTVTTPGTAPSAITVGSVGDISAPPPILANAPWTGAFDVHDAGPGVMAYSSRGPTLSGAVKPDIMAPGNSVVGAVQTSSTAYGVLSGTSMAAPYISGLVALGLEAVPDATPAQVKQALMTTAKDVGMPGVDNEWGAGLVDARAFVDVLKGIVEPERTAFPKHRFLRGELTDAHPSDHYTLSIGAEDAGPVLVLPIAPARGAYVCSGSPCTSGKWAPRSVVELSDGEFTFNSDPGVCDLQHDRCVTARSGFLANQLGGPWTYDLDVVLPQDYESWRSLGLPIVYSVDYFYGAPVVTVGRPDLAPSVTTPGSTLSVLNRTSARLVVAAIAPAASSATVTVTWGDGTTATRQVACSDVSGVCAPTTLTRIHPRRGSFAVKVAVVASGERVVVARTATVRNNVPRWATSTTLRFPRSRPVPRLVATDVDRDRLTYRLTSGRLPTGLRLRSDGVVARVGKVRAGTYVGVVAVGDGHGGTVSRRFTFVVAR
ncbi:hypothetical protein ASE01_07660 [Nocardioides sp. Root190]|uniref:S8 family serine peptidase n=1 Tax=Nocardioides sp. Root190 TaxID=1736488 RepID=UPI0006F41917|nr:S8 family serine peptidase [Nocardioides sp. Root190]KRB78037.1 hypothetical protein ASE01_07660 [Nocardioides sp. Root190]